MNRVLLLIIIGAIVAVLFVLAVFAGHEGDPVGLPARPSGQHEADIARANISRLWEENAVKDAYLRAHHAEELRQRALEEARERRRRETARPTYQAASVGTGRCGGDLPPCHVMLRESGGDIRRWNGHKADGSPCYAPVGWRGRVAPDCPGASSSASGKWQFVRGTWANHRGYLNAADAPEWVQDEKARQVWNGGKGASHWRLTL